MSNNNLKKIDIVKELSNKTGFSKNLSKKLIDDLIDILSLNIKNNHLILKNIGSFKTVFKKERVGRNPKTKEKFKISSRKSITFTASNSITSILN